MSNNLTFYSNEEVRPYEGLEDIQDALAELELFLRSRNSWTSSSEISFRDDNSIKPNFKARLDLTNSSTITSIKEGIKKTGYDEKEIIFAGLVRGKSSKGMRPFLKESFSNILAKGGMYEFDIPFDEQPSITKEATLQIEFYLIANSNKPKNSPKPTTKGTWLAQKQFLLKGQQHGSLRFKFEDLTEEIRREKNLGKYSTIFVENIYPMHTVSNISECMIVYLDKDLHDFLRSTQNKALKEYLWADLVAKALHSSLQFCLPQIKQSNQSFEEIERSTAFGALMRSLANTGTRMGTKFDPDDVFNALLERPELASEFLEDRVKLSRRLIEFAGESE